MREEHCRQYADFQNKAISIIEASWRNSSSASNEQISYKSEWANPAMFLNAVMFLKTATGGSTSAEEVYINDHAYKRPVLPPVNCEAIVRRPLLWNSVYNDPEFDYDLFHSESPDNVVTYGHVRDFLVGIGIRDGMEVLDVGCGNGWLLNNFGISRYTGIDPSYNLVHQLQSRYKLSKGRRVIQCRFDDYVSRSQFDFVLVLFGSANQIDYEALKRIPSFLKPNGMGVIMYESPVPDVLPPMPFDNRVIASYADHVVEHGIVPDLSIHPFDIEIVRR